MDAPAVHVDMAFGVPPLTRPGRSKLRMEAVAGTQVTTPDHASLDLTTGLDVRIWAALDNYDTGDVQALVLKSAVGQVSWSFYLQSNDTLAFDWSYDGTTTEPAASVTLDASPGEPLWLRVTWDADNGASGNDTKFYKSRNGTDWEQLGATVTRAGTTSLHAGTAILRIGRADAFFPAATVYKMELRDAPDGSIVANPDFTIQTDGATSFVDAAGRTWTLAGDSEIIGSGDWTNIDDEAPAIAATTKRGVRIKTGDIEASRSVITVDHVSRALDSRYEGSPYWPDVTLRTRTRATVDLPGEDERRFCTGYIRRFIPEWGLATSNLAMELDDIFSVLGGASLPPSVFEYEAKALGPVSYYPLAETIGDYVDDIIGTNDGTYERDVTPGESLLPWDKRTGQTLGMDGADSESWRQLARLPSTACTDEFTLVWWVRFDEAPAETFDLWWQPSTGSPAGHVWVSIAATGELSLEATRSTASTITRVRTSGSLIPLGIFDGATHMIAVTCSTSLTPTDTTLFLDGEVIGLAVSTTTGTGTSFGWSGETTIGSSNQGETVASSTKAQVAQVLRYDQSLSWGSISDLYEAGTNPWAGDLTGTRIDRICNIIGIDPLDRNIAAGTVECGPAVFDSPEPVAYLRKVVATEGGALFANAEGQLTFLPRPDPDADPIETYAGNADEGIPYEVIQPVEDLDRTINMVDVTRDGGIVQHVEDAVSVGANGPLAITVDTVAADPSVARAIGERIVEQSAEPRRIVPAVTLNGRHRSMTLEATLDIEILDTVDVLIRPPGG